jgi:hypothetical protein
VSGHVLVDLAAIGTDLLVSFLMVAHVLLEGVHVGQLLLAQVTRDHQMGPWATALAGQSIRIDRIYFMRAVV